MHKNVFQALARHRPIRVRRPMLEVAGHEILNVIDGRLLAAGTRIQHHRHRSRATVRTAQLRSGRLHVTWNAQKFPSPDVKQPYCPARSEGTARSATSACSVYVPGSASPGILVNGEYTVVRPGGMYS